MEKDHFIGKVAQKALIEKEGKILISRFPTDKVWDLPGGRLHRGEQPSEGLAREIKEELGIDVLIKEPFFVEMTTAQSGEKRYFVAFKVHMNDETQPFVFQKEEVAEVAWLDKSQVESTPLFEVCRRAIKAYFSVR